MRARFTSTIHGRVSRRTIALHPLAWTMVASCFALIGVVCVVIAVAVPPFEGLPTAALAIALFSVAAVLFSQPAPEADTLLPHFAVAAVYVCTTGGMFAFAPQSATALPAAIFVGPVAAVWLDKKRHWAPHCIAAPVLLSSPLLFAHADRTTLISLCTVVVPTIMLGACVRVVLRLAESQSRRLENLAMRDPLTGVGNRRMLDEAFASELLRHHATRRPFTLFAFDLNGFKTINDTLGHGAGDRVLQDVAARLVDLAGEHATVCRLGGDEFVVLSPNTHSSAAAELGEHFRRRLGPAITAGLGSATLPNDGVDQEDLLALADSRLMARKAAARRDAEPDDASWVNDIILPAPIEEPRPSQAPRRRRPLSRDVLGAGKLLWRVTAVMFFFFAAIAITFIVADTKPGQPLSSPFALPLALIGLLIGASLLASRPPALHTWGSELTLVFTYLVPAAAFVVVRPDASALIGFGIFVGPLVSVRTRTRRRTGAHVVAALTLYLAICASGVVNASSVVAIGLLSLITIVLTLFCVTVLEACEAQGAELERLSTLDPLTLLANRRSLDDGLAGALRAAAEKDSPVAVIALDLNGFKNLNDTIGHGAGDQLLMDVATQLRALVSADGLVARPGGDEFTIVVANQPQDAITGLAQRLKETIAELSRSGCQISTGIGIAHYPADGQGPHDLLAVADRRLINDKYGHEPAAGRDRDPEAPLVS